VISRGIGEFDESNPQAGRMMRCGMGGTNWYFRCLWVKVGEMMITMKKMKMMTTVISRRSVEN